MPPRNRRRPTGPAGFGIEYDYHAVHEEYEQTRFSAQGVVRTADGREISFDPRTVDDAQLPRGNHDHASVPAMRYARTRWY
jgi:hypothetical protein